MFILNLSGKLKFEGELQSILIFCFGRTSCSNFRKRLHEKLESGDLLTGELRAEYRYARLLLQA
jgi:hypothetical protein